MTTLIAVVQVVVILVLGLFVFDAFEPEAA